MLVIPLVGRAADAVAHRRAALATAATVAMGAVLLMPSVPLTAPLLAAACIQGVAAAAMTPLGDAVALPLASAGRLDYGRTRAWGSVSYTVAAAGVGALLGGEGTRAVPPLLAAIYLLTAMSSLMMPEAPRLAHTRQERANPFHFPKFRLVVLASALIQGAHAAYYNFAALRWRAAGVPDGIVGLLVAEGIVAEIALFIWGRALVERIGPGRLTIIAATVSAVRWTALAFVVDVPVLAALQLLHAGTFALQHLSAMLVLREIGARRAATAQTWLAALGGALPGAALTWLAGQLYSLTPGSAFLAMTAVAMLALPVGVRLHGLALMGKRAPL